MDIWTQSRAANNGTEIPVFGLFTGHFIAERTVDSAQLREKRIRVS